jgi:CRP/FNR family cyclic AMP-dependent transcriptional regulator
MKTGKQAHGKKKPGTFDAEAFLNSAGVSRAMMEFGKNEMLFSQGDPCTHMIYIRKGRVKMSVVSRSGKEAVVGIMGPGDFIGEGGWRGSQREWQQPLPFRL